jgi:hypothetical protein
LYRAHDGHDRAAELGRDLESARTALSLALADWEAAADGGR